MSSPHKSQQAPASSAQTMLVYNSRRGAIQLAKRKAAREQSKDEKDSARYLPIVVGCDVLRMLPGVNAVSASDADKFGVNEQLSDDLAPFRVPGNEAKALEIVKTSASKKGLEAWLAIEARPKIKAALEARLKSFR